MTTAAEPWPFVAQRWLDGLRSLPEPGALATFARVYRWTLDEFPVPGALAEDVAERLYRDDAFFRGTLELAGRRLGPERLEAPVVAVVDPASRLVPPDAVLPFLEAARCHEAAVIRHGEEVGVALQHVGALVGARAHAAMWPAVLERLRAWWEGRAPAVPLPEVV
jgi:polyhydroxyalkanoate synthase